MRILKDKKGQALVEMALILPILLLFIFGITEFGRVFATDLVLNHAAREGARAASVGSSDSDVLLIVKNRALVLSLDSSKLIVSINPLEGSRCRGDAVTVKIKYPVKIYAPVISNIIGNSYIVSGETIMRIE